MNDKKPFYTKLWFWLIVVITFLLCVGNILLAHFNKDNGANIFTAVSGWVSGIATAILGVIAVVQNRKYKEENDLTLKEQERIITNFANSQQDLAWRNLQYQFFNSYLNTLLQQKNRLLECTFEKIHNDLISLPCNKESFAKIVYEKNILLENIDSLIEFLKTSKYFFDCKDTLYNLSQQYYSSVIEFITFITTENNYEIIYNLFKTPIDRCLNKEKQLYKRFKQLADNAAKIRKSFNYELSSHINEIYAFIADIYYNSTDELKIAIVKNENNYDKWKEKIEIEEQNNG